MIIIFVDTDEHRVLPTLKEMASHRLIVRENVVLEHRKPRLRCQLSPLPTRHLMCWQSPLTAMTSNRPAEARC